MINLIMVILLILIAGQITTIFLYYPQIKARAKHRAYESREYNRVRRMIKYQYLKVDSVSTQVSDIINFYHSPFFNENPLGKESVY